MNWLARGISLSILLVSTAVIAVPYSLPNDGDWYQLQDLVTYQEYCNSSDESCDVPAGTYALINHSVPVSDPSHRQVVSVVDSGQPVTPPTTPVANFRLDTQIVRESCIDGYPGRPEDFDNLGRVVCTAQCPSGYSLTGGSCYASRDDRYVDELEDGFVARQMVLRIPTIAAPAADSYSCTIDIDEHYHTEFDFFVSNNFTQTDMESTAICAAVVAQ